MSEFAIRMGLVAEKAARLAQEENRRKGIANVYCLNGALVWQLPDGTLTTKEPKL